jgi:hypothetical protein
MPLKPPAPVTPQSKTSPARTVVIPPTVQETDTLPSDQEIGPIDKQRSDFRTNEFYRVIRQKGYFLKWRKAILCTCVNSETEQANMNCTACDGSGFFYVDPIDIQGLMTNFNKKDDIYQRPGHWLSGDSVVTVEPQYRLGFRDSLEMKDSIMVFNEWMVKANREGVRANLADNYDAARYAIVSAVAAFVDDSGSPFRLTEGTHFTVTKEGLIRWTASGNSVVEDGSYVSIHYEFHPVWIVLSYPHALRDTVSTLKRANQTVEALPLQATVKLDYLNTANSLNETRFAPVTGTVS